jgi:hypothetical protein
MGSKQVFQIFSKNFRLPPYYDRVIPREEIKMHDFKPNLSHQINRVVEYILTGVLWDQPTWCFLMSKRCSTQSASNFELLLTRVKKNNGVR